MGSIKKEESQSLLCWVSFTLWNIWKARCEIVYEHLVPNPIVVIHRIGAAVQEFLENSCSCSPHRPSATQSGPVHFAWCPPDPGFTKINCDRTWDVESKKLGLVLLLGTVMV